MSKALYYAITENGREVYKTTTLYAAAFEWNLDRLKQEVWVVDKVGGSRQMCRIKQLSEPFLREVLRRGVSSL